VALENVLTLVYLNVLVANGLMIVLRLLHPLKFVMVLMMIVMVYLMVLRT